MSTPPADPQGPLEPAGAPVPEAESPPPTTFWPAVPSPDARAGAQWPAGQPGQVTTEPVPAGRSETSIGAALVAIATLIGALAGLPAAWLWARLADPAASSLAAQGLACAESELGHQTRVTGWYIAIGAAICVVAGLLIGWLARRLGRVTVAAVLGFAIAAAAVTALVGLHAFSPTGREQITCQYASYLLENKLKVGTVLAYLTWPAAGLIGLCAAAFGWGEGPNLPPVPPSSSTLDPRSSYVRTPPA